MKKKQVFVITTLLVVLLTMGVVVAGKTIQSQSILHPDLGLVIVTAEEPSIWSQFFAAVRFTGESEERYTPTGWHAIVFPEETHEVTFFNVDDGYYGDCLSLSQCESGCICEDDGFCYK